MGRKPNPKNDLYRPLLQESVYIYNYNSLYDVKKILTDLETGALNYSPCYYSTTKALSFCNIDHEFNWAAILPITEAARDARAKLGAGAKIVLPDWLPDVFIAVFPNGDWQVVLGQDRLQVMRLLGDARTAVNVIRDVDMEHYRIPLPSVSPKHLGESPPMRIVTRLDGEDEDFINPGNSSNVEKLIIAYVAELLKLQVMFEASGYTIDQARTKIATLRIPFEFSWGSFENKIKALHESIVKLNSSKEIKGAFLSDIDMDRRKNHRAWKKKSKQVCQNIVWLSAALGQAREMQKAAHFMERRLRTNPHYRTREDFLTRAALRSPSENGEEISLLGLTQIAVLSAVNPADLWLSYDSKRHELEFAAVVACLSNLQPALLTPATAQAAIEIRERARTAPDSCTEEQIVALMLIERLEKTCSVDEFMAFAHNAVRTREPVRVSLANNILPSWLVVESMSELFSGMENSDAEAVVS